MLRTIFPEPYIYHLSKSSSLLFMMVKLTNGSCMLLLNPHYLPQFYDKGKTFLCELCRSVTSNQYRDTCVISNIHTMSLHPKNVVLCCVISSLDFKDYGILFVNVLTFSTPKFKGLIATVDIHCASLYLTMTL